MAISDLVHSVVARKGPLFFVNHLVLGPIAIWLAIEIVVAHGFHRSPQFAARAIGLSCVAIFGYLSFVLGRPGNARLLPCFLATGLVAEVLVRALGPFGHPVGFALGGASPYSMFGGPSNGRMLMPPQVGGSEQERLARFNAEGFRIEEEIPDPKPADELRIFVLGGSTLVFGAPLANTIPGVIESQLRANGLPQARVYDFGVIAFVSGQELSLLDHRLIDLKPDLVIAYDGGNELFMPWYYDPRPGYPFNFIAWEEALDEFAADLGLASRTIRGLAVDSAVMQAIIGTPDWTIRVGLDDYRRRSGYGSEAWKRAVVDAYARNILMMCRVAHGSEALFAAFFQPILAYSNDLDPQRLQTTGGEEIAHGLREQRALVPPTVAARLQATAVGQGCRFHDLSGIFEDDPTGFFDHIHVDNAHNQVIGRRIANELLAWDALRLRRGGR
jgi:hypothetical protein